MKVRILLSALFLFSIAIPAAGEELRLRHAVSLYTDDKGLGMKQPEGVACEGASGVIVADTGNGRLLRYTVEEARVKAVQEIITGEAGLPARVQIGSQGDLFVLDSRRRRIMKLGPEGKVRGDLELKGVPSAEAMVIRSFVVGPSDDVYLLDTASERVLVLSAEGNYLRSTPFPDGSGFISDLAVDKRGTVYLVDSVNGTVYGAAKEGFTVVMGGLREKLQMAFPSAIAVDERERIYLMDRNSGNLVVLAREGSFLSRQFGRGWTEGLFRYPAQICLNESGQAFVADWGNNRVQMFVTGK